jgi:biotin carboxyl carrier protein
MEYVASAEGREVPIKLLDGGRRIAIGDRVHQVDMKAIGSNSLLSLLVDNSSYELLVEEHQAGFRVLLEGRLYEIHVQSKDRHRLSGLASARPQAKTRATIRAPMPGMVVSVPVAVGEAVASGDVLAILESMKMENEVRAPQDGVVQEIHVSDGDLVNGDQVLLIVE